MIRMTVDTMIVIMVACAVIGGLIHYAVIHCEDWVARWKYKRQLKKQKQENKLTGVKDWKIGRQVRRFTDDKENE